MYKYNIAGIPIEIISNELNALDIFSMFSSHREEISTLKIQLNSCNNICPPEGNLLMNEGFPWFQRSSDGHVSVHIYSEASKEIEYMLDVDENWQNASISFLENTSDIEYSLSGALGEILFRNHILFHQGIVLHAAAIEWQGKGILFSAPSETGKSTQARLWKEYMGAKILNGDRPAIRIIDNIPHVFGTPWSGSSCEFLNDHAPLSAIVMLEQASENSIRRLSNFEAVSKLMPRAFLPYYSDKLMGLAIANLENIITSTPIYLLKCKPDREAVELVYQCVK